MGKAYLIFKIFFFLGVTSFGGPTAHIGYLHNKFVDDKQWFSSKDFFDLVTMCQFFPGPTSSQVVYSIGLIRMGFWGGLLAWLGFILPSACIMISLAYGVNILSSNSQLGFFHGLISVSVPVVAIAVWQMGRSLCIDVFHWLIAVTSVMLLMLLEPGIGHLTVIFFGLVSGLFLKISKKTFEPSKIKFVLGNRLRITLIVLFFLLLILTIIISKIEISQDLTLFANLYKTGTLVFGGGHVVLPLLETDFVSTDILGKDEFLAGYGFAQAIPGPLFSFVAYCGTLMKLLEQNIWFPAIFGIICVFFIYIPTFLIIPLALWLWSKLCLNLRIRAIFSGISAAVVGLLAHSFIFHIAPFCLSSKINILFVFIGFIMLGLFKLPSWSVVLTLGSFGWTFHTIAN